MIGQATASADPIPAIREEDATGETAAIFADLRTTLGVPFVNLIWRHLATIPGGLEPTWTTLKPLYASGELHRRRCRLQEAIGTLDLSPVPVHVWDSVGVAEAERRRIDALIAHYNDANAVNFLGLVTAVAVLRGDVAVRDNAPADEGCPPPTPPSDVPRLLGLSELSPALLRTVQDLDDFGRLGDNGVIASLVRHLAHWPAFLGIAHTALTPLHRSGRLQSAQESVIAAGRRQAGKLASLLPSDASLPRGEAAEQVLDATDEFIRLMIGRMIVMGHAMGRLLPS